MRFLWPENVIAAAVALLVKSWSHPRCVSCGLLIQLLIRKVMFIDSFRSFTFVLVMLRFSVCFVAAPLELDNSFVVTAILLLKFPPVKDCCCWECA